MNTEATTSDIVKEWLDARSNRIIYCVHRLVSINDCIVGGYVMDGDGDLEIYSAYRNYVGLIVSTEDIQASSQNWIVAGDFKLEVVA